jgi:hypothetical protein
MDEFVLEILKKLLTSAASAAGSKVGGKASEFVFGLFGIGGNAELNAINDELNKISDQINRTEAQLADVTNRIRWNQVTKGLEDIRSTINPHNDNLKQYLKISDKTKRDKGIRDYLLADPSLAGLDKDLASMHDTMMGTGGTLTVTDVALIQVYLETHWSTLLALDKTPSAMHKKILDIYTQAAQTQRLATTLSVAYWEALGQSTPADTARNALEPRLIEQYKKMLEVAPEFVILNDFASPGLALDFSEFQIAPNFVNIGTIAHATFGNMGKPSMPAVEGLVPGISPSPLPANWTLKRIGADPGAPNYTLNAVVPLIPGNPDFIASERAVRMYMRQLLHSIEMVDQSVATSPLVFSIELTDEMNLLRFKLADGRTTGLIKISGPGSAYYFGLTDTEATPQNGLVTLSQLNKKPVVGRPTLSAWSNAFATTPAGEGRFKPGYRVRYRVVHVNRFGESDKSDWLLAPKVNEDHQDSQGYFGNSTYYFPQIALAVDPTGRTEGYRVFRQFQGDREEEVTGGRYTGDPISGKTVIFDDFMV